MVQFNEKSFSVTVDCASNPSEDYVQTINQIINLLQAQNDDLRSCNFYVLELLREMMPTCDQAKKMSEELKD